MLIEIFTDFIRNKKDLREYVEIRKGINEHGEFNDANLIQIQENLERLKKENIEIYNNMYTVLEEIIKQDRGQFVDYSLNFAREILKMFKTQPLEDIYEEYKDTLTHKYQTMN